MSIKLVDENKLAEELKSTFQTAKVEVKREKRITVELRSDLVAPFLAHVKDYLSFNHMAHMSCVDWIEDKEFELVYIVYSYERNIMLVVKTRIDREKAEFVSLRHLWDQIETYEREIYEMYGINFTGNDRLGEFILEDWEDLPPMRRDFDTIGYAKEHYYTRPGREDAKDVREVISENSGEELPDFAKEFSVRSKE